MKTLAFADSSVEILKALAKAKLEPKDIATVATRYAEVTEALRQLEAQKEVLRRELLAFNGEQGFETPDFLVHISEAVRESVAGLKEFDIKGLGKVIRDLDLVNTVKYKIIKVLKR